jgi:hypothetical protein
LCQFTVSVNEVLCCIDPEAAVTVIPIKEATAVTLQAEFNNVWNHPMWGTPSGSLISTSFGTSSISTGTRQIELRGNIRF